MEQILPLKKNLISNTLIDLNDELLSGDDVFLLHSLKKERETKILWLESEDSVVTTKRSETVGSFLKQRARWISKAGSYSDHETKVLAIVTFVAVFLQLFLLIASIFNGAFIPVFLVCFLVKSVPDFLIVQNIASGYGREKLLGFFIPAQLIYPFYVFSVLFYYLISNKKYYSLRRYKLSPLRL